LAGMSNEVDDTIRQHSGWLIPLGVFAATAVVSFLVLLAYLAPTPLSLIEKRPSPTAQTDPVLVSVNGQSFSIPANYILYKSDRQAGPHNEVALAAISPDFRGYSDRDSQTFAGNATDSPVVYLLIREEPLDIGEAERLKRIYLGYVADSNGQAGPFGLTQYAFRDDSGYRGEDLFVGAMQSGPAVLHCVRLSAQVPNPSCMRDMPIAPGVALSYRFKRAHLTDWREIAAGVRALIDGFRANAKKAS
jgi:hypothetical protein